MKRRAIASAAAAAAMFASLSACGSDTSDTGRADAARDDKAAASTEIDLLSQQIAAAQDRAISAHVAAEIDVLGMQATIDGEFSVNKSRSRGSADLRIAASGKPGQVRFIDGVAYVKGLGMTSRSAKPWVKIDLNDPANPLSKYADMTDFAGFSAMLGAVGNVTDEGAERVDGVDARHYSVTIDTAKLVKSAGPLKTVDPEAAGLPSQVTGQLWVDDASRPVKLLVSLGAAGSVTAHFSAYGDAVVVHAPPADKVDTFAL